MHQNTELEAYLALAKSIYARLIKEGSFPWADSPNSRNLIDSGDSPDRV